MPRLSISLSSDRHRALKEAAAARGKSITVLIDESLEFYGIKTRKHAAELVRQARERAHLTEDEAQAVAIEETREVRSG